MTNFIDRNPFIVRGQLNGHGPLMDVATVDAGEHVLTLGMPAHGESLAMTHRSNTIECRGGQFYWTTSYVDPNASFTMISGEAP